jgi:lipid A ethanolaminephosphotransferase
VANKSFEYIDNDVKSIRTSKNKGVMVIVVGETARSANFSLNGYSRETNPLLKKQNIINFTDATSAGTYTAFSVPAMFSHKTRRDFNVEQAKYTENLLDLLQKSGWNVIWKENNSGCKGVCKRITTIKIDPKENLSLCDGAVCYDEIALEGLENQIANTEGNIVIVLHIMGSHGPTYYKRYPEQFKIFTPTCDTAELQSCPKEYIINTYDNTIIYTDYVLNGIIEILKKFPNYETSMIYASDHGESLGENGIYLHGMPYSLAPDYQKKVPMIMWFSENNNIDTECMKNVALKSASHDNLFHTILGLTETQSKTYNKELDLSSNCKIKP